MINKVERLGDRRTTDTTVTVDRRIAERRKVMRRGRRDVLVCLIGVAVSVILLLSFLLDKLPNVW